MRLPATVKQVVVILALALVAAGASAVFHPKRPAWYRTQDPSILRWQITTEEAAAIASEREVLWIDARERAKYEEDHLENAILLTPAEWADLMFEHLDTLQDADGKAVVVYCDSEECGKSRYVAEQLREIIGLDPVYVMVGDWREIRDKLP